MLHVLLARTRTEPNLCLMIRAHKNTRLELDLELILVIKLLANERDF